MICLSQVKEIGQFCTDYVNLIATKYNLILLCVCITLFSFIIPLHVLSTQQPMYVIQHHVKMVAFVNHLVQASCVSVIMGSLGCCVKYHVSHLYSFHILSCIVYPLYYECFISTNRAGKYVYFPRNVVTFPTISYVLCISLFVKKSQFFTKLSDFPGRSFLISTFFSKSNFIKFFLNDCKAFCHFETMIILLLKSWRCGPLL